MAEDILKKLLKNIAKSFVGQDAEKLVEVLYKKRNVNEFFIAKKLNLTINQTRTLLYKLADEGLVGFIRKKDKKKGGWYTYFWTMEEKRGLSRFKEEIERSVDEFSKQLKQRETERQYYCKNCDLEYKEEDAMLNEYTCLECGEVLEIRKTETIASNIKEEMKKLENTLSLINKEMKIIEEKEGKSTERKLKLEQKKKEEERRTKRVEREKLKADEARKINKKKAEKKARRVSKAKKPKAKKKK